MANDLLIMRLNAIAEKTSALIDENNNLSNDNKNLVTEISQLKKIVAVQKNSIEILEQKNKLTNIASIVSSLSEDEKKDIKKSISFQIKEIDKCLKLLKN